MDHFLLCPKEHATHKKQIISNIFTTIFILWRVWSNLSICIAFFVSTRGFFRGLRRITVSSKNENGRKMAQLQNDHSRHHCPKFCVLSTVLIFLCNGTGILLYNHWIVELYDVRIKLNNHILQCSNLKQIHEIEQ